jgi:hypothetical protein
MVSFRTTILLLLLALATPALAGGDEYEATGQVQIATNVEYAVANIDGERWEDTEYRKGGKTLVVMEINFAKLPMVIEVEARDNPGYRVEKVKVTRKNFRKKRSGRVYHWVYKTTVKFRVAKKKADPKAPAGPEKKPVQPKPGGDDDL